MTRRTLLAAAGALVALAAACVGTGAAAPARTSHVDLPKSYQFQPSVITVPAGTTVTWTNEDTFTHSVRLVDQGDRVIGPMRPGQTVSYRFTTAGTYHYDCSLHPQDMRGAVIVT